MEQCSESRWVNHEWRSFQRVLSVSNQSFTLSRGTSGSNGAWRRWSTGTVELGDGGDQERWRSGSGTQEQRDCRQAVRGSGESPWNVWDQTVTVWEECVDIVLLVTGYMWRWSVISWVGSGVCSWWWLWLPDTVYIHKTLLNQIISISPATSLRYWLMSFRQFEFH